MEHLRHTVLGRDAVGRSDAQLLDSFAMRREESAFEALLHRHGPMVLSVCRRILANSHDAEDAFQATFLVLVRKARSIRSKELVASWLYGVAQQTALKARAASAKRQLRERQVNAMPEPQAHVRESQTDVLRLLDQELSRLPDKHRVPIVLCDLEGKSRQEAAAQLGVPEGTLSSRLTRGRTALARRLTRHGITFTGGAIAALLAEQTASAFVPAALAGATLHAARAVQAGNLVAGCVTTKVALLTDQVLRMMLLAKLKKLTAVLVLVGVLAFSCTLLSPGEGTQPVRAGTPASSTKHSEDEKKPAAKPQAPVTLTLVRVRGKEYFARRPEGELQDKDVRHVIFACELVLENNSGEELIVQSNFFSAYDGLSLMLLKEGKELARRPYIGHQSPMAEAKPYILKKGKNTAEVRIPVNPMAETWPTLQAKLVGTLPHSKFKGSLESNVVKVERVEDFEPPKKEPAKKVSLELSKAVAERRDNDVYIYCDIRIDNVTGKVLNVKSTFYSAYDGLELMVTDKKGNVLAQPKYIDGRSPYTPKGRDFPIKEGSTSANLRFTVRGLAKDVNAVKVRVVGTLPGSAYKGPLASDTLEIAVPADAAETAKIISLIEARGGHVIRDEKAPGRPIVEVDMNQLFAGGITDETVKLLAELKTIERLQLGGRKITDAELKKIAVLSNVRLLNLGGAKITDEGVKELQRMPKLEDVWLAGTAITTEGLKHVSKAKSLKVAGFYNTNVDDLGVAALAPLADFESLALDKTRITDRALIHLAAFPKLKKLTLGQSKISNDGLKALLKLQNLRTLYLNETPISDDGMKIIAQMPQLRELALGASKVGDAGVRHLAALKNLQYLSLGSTGVTDACLPAIGTMKDLEGLQLGYTKISDRGLAALETLHKLRMLDLYGAPVTKAAADRLKEKLPKCNMSVRN
jgi:RNA polymerase sigma factor (sigma-70 family)